MAKTFDQMLAEALAKDATVPTAAVWKAYVAEEDARRAAARAVYEGGAAGGKVGSFGYCACGEPATWYTAASQIANTLGAFAEALDGNAPAPGPSQATQATHCDCGAELMGAKAVERELCGDCARENLPGLRGDQTLDQRIAATQKPAVDRDPTSEWTAGATPGYDWSEWK